MDDWRGEDIQAIADIKPTKVIVKEEPGKEVPTVEEAKDKALPTTDYDIFKYLRLPPPKECNLGVLGDIKSIVKILKPEAESNDDFFMILQAIDKWTFSDEGNPLSRIDSILNFAKTYKGKVKETLESQGAITLDVLEQEAKRTGNWSKYFKYSEKINDKIRSKR